MSHTYHEHSDAHDHAGHDRTRFWVRNIGFAVIFMIVGGALTLVGDRLLSNTANETRIATYQDWNVICPPASTEGAECSLSSQRSGVLSLVIGGKLPGLQVWVPHGVLLDPGLGFSVGDSALKVLPYETCMPQGCLVLVGLDSETLKTMQTAQAGQVVLVPGNGTPVTLPFSLKGFSDGYAALESAKDRRNSIWNFLSN